MHKLIMVVALAFGVLAFQTAPAAADSNILFIFDASGSMKVASGGQSRIVGAKRAMDQALTDMPASTRLGLLMFGHRRGKDCTDIELVAPIGADDAAKINRTIQAVQPRGETPIAESLRQAARSFAALKGQTNRIVLITDGIEECGGDPCQAAREIRDSGFDLKVHVVGFTLTAAQRRAVQCVAEVTGGRMLDARDSAGLSRALAEVRQEVAQAPPPAPPPAQPLARSGNLLLAENGGRVVWAPGLAWGGLATTSEPPKDNRAILSMHHLPREVVFGFKDGQAASFSRFTVYIPAASARNLKEFELFAGDDAFGEFRSLGRFEAKNIRLMRTPYQEFEVAETTARFLKVRLISTHGDTPVNLFGFQLFGELDGKPVAAPAYGPKPDQIDVLDKAQGGALVSAPFAQWENAIARPSGNLAEKEIASTHALPSVATFAFNEGRAATFDKIAVLVPGSHARNVRTLEVLAGDDPVGEFRSLGRFTTRNVRVFDSPYQEFELPETTARFVRLRLIDTHGDMPLYIFQVKLYGALTGDAQAPTAFGPAPGQIDLIAKANGGNLLAAPFAQWEGVISAADDYDGRRELASTHRLPSEAIFAFRDEQAATFDKFAMLVPQAHRRNARQFEILASDDMSGEFRSLGRFATQNIRFQASPYQEFALPQTTARYVKVRLLNTHGDMPLYLYPMKLFGSLGGSGQQASAAATASASAAAATAAAPAMAGADLLHIGNGGMLLAAPDPSWEKLTTRSADNTEPKDPVVGYRLPIELIYAFKDEKPATISGVRVLVPSTFGRNLRQFEVLAGDDVSGPFASLGTFQTQNLRLVRTPFQEFALPPTETRYLKLRLLNTHGETPMYVYGVQVIGRQ